MDKKFAVQIVVILIVIFGGILTVFNPGSFGLPSIVPGGGIPGVNTTGTTVSLEKQQILFIDAASTGSPELVKSVITVDVADDPNERAQGLSGREIMEENEGMMFVFSQPTVPNFIMREMRFSLDFVWVNGDKIVDLYENAPPEVSGTPNNEMKTYTPSSAVDKVIEVNAGYIKKFGLKVGDRISIQVLPATDQSQSAI
jgi:uncharacterized membrane protein (UPF0127 family)